MPPQEQQRAQRGCPLPWVLGAPRAHQSSSSDVVLLQPPPRFGRAPATCRAYLGPRPSAASAAPPRPPAARFATLASGRRGPRGAVSPRRLQLAAPSAPQPAPPAPAAGTAPTPRRAPCRRLHFPSHAPSLFTAAHAHARARTDVSHAHRPSRCLLRTQRTRAPSPGRKCACPGAATPPGKCSPRRAAAKQAMEPSYRVPLRS